MSMRGVVMSLDEGRATVLLPGGVFRTVPLQGQAVDIGQEIWIPEPHSRKYGWWAIPLVAAIGIFLVLSRTTAPILGSSSVVAVLSVDINPSINLDISSQGRVVGEVGFDAAGKKLLQTKSLLGLKAPSAVEYIVSEAYRDGYLSSSTPDIVLGAVFTKHKASWFDELSSMASKIMYQDRVNGSVVTVSGISARLVAEMNKPEVSVGRYLLWQHGSLAVRRALTAIQVRTMPVEKLLASTTTVIAPASTPPVSTGLSSSPTRESPTTTESHSESSSPSVAIRSSQSVLPSLPISTPSISVSTPVLSLQVGGSGGSSENKSPQTSSSSASGGLLDSTPPSATSTSAISPTNNTSTAPTSSSHHNPPPSSSPPAHSTPPLNPITTVSSVLNQLGL